MLAERFSSVLVTGLSCDSRRNAIEVEMTDENKTDDRL